LDEGTLLVIQIPTIILPLGKIFEVFGSVALPLYTLRLPPPPSNSTTTKKLNTTITAPATDAVAEESPNQKESTELDPPIVEEDSWSLNGKYTKLLKQQKHMTVYFVKDVSTLIDTHTIMKHSGRGCDASNVYDEELDAKDVKFSDDEQERLSKQQRKRCQQRQ
jgi:hypothetical protein